MTRANKQPTGRATQAGIKKSLDRINSLKEEIAARRDRLRTEFFDLECMLESLDTGLADIDSGRRMIEDAIDSLSLYV